jgi:hypothetical protein
MDIASFPVRSRTQCDLQDIQVGATFIEDAIETRDMGFDSMDLAADHFPFKFCP